jgi:ssRNA-specific RNase YbeY (16S rRNA maturation enzyme)
MSKFWKNACEIATGIASLPVVAVAATVDSLSSDKTFGEAWKKHEDSADRVVSQAGEFGEKNGHMINHGIIHAAKHLAGGK